jgi:hypothetical protein
LFSGTGVGTFDPTPRSVEDVVRRLPASARANIEWFPEALRSSFIEPLRRTPPSELGRVLDEVVIDAVRLLLRLFANVRGIPALLENDVLPWRSVTRPLNRRNTNRSPLLSSPWK